MLAVEADLAPSGLLERTEAERARPLAAVVEETTVAILPSLPFVRWSASCECSSWCVPVGERGGDGNKRR